MWAAVVGKLHDASGSWYLPLSGVTVLAIIMAIFVLYAGRDREDSVINIS